MDIVIKVLYNELNSLREKSSVKRSNYQTSKRR